MTSAPIIAMNRVSLNYRVHHQRSRSLKATAIAKLKQNDYADYYPALKLVDLDVNPGDTVALMGINGSGKSSLLKLVAGIFEPSSGAVKVGGRVVALLELGAGFASDLTGLENIFLNAALLGEPRERTQRNLESIVAFSELGHFIDSPLRHYSSGMFMRLGFAVAIHSAAQVLLLDEVLAVGDAGFQGKCFEAIQRKRAEGTTMVIVSHAPGTLEGLCNRGVVLHYGQVHFDGELTEAVDRYEKLWKHRPEPESGGAPG